MQITIKIHMIHMIVERRQLLLLLLRRWWRRRFRLVGTLHVGRQLWASLGRVQNLN